VVLFFSKLCLPWLVLLGWTNSTSLSGSKMTFLMKTSETKRFVQIFCEAFFYFKKYFASPIRDLFSFLQKPEAILM
jgi:hypothetical protein